MNLFDIKDPMFLKTLKAKELKALAASIRSFLIESIGETGGHLSSNLGTIELIIALHYVFDSPKDALLFDVGHQSYTHKILTGRAKEFSTLRQKSGLSGYINYQESPHDQWESGHAGSSLSALTGFLYAKHLKNEEGEGVAVIGDASITNGMAFEALNLLGNDKNIKGIIVLNDNEMSISKSVGAISKTLTRFRTMKSFIKMKRLWQVVSPKFVLSFLSRIKRAVRSFFQRQNIFEDFGYMYIGPVDGHDIMSLIYTLKRIKKHKNSVVLHILTDKGKGHVSAENDKIGTYHGISSLKAVKEEGISWSEVISRSIEALQKHRKTFVVMPAMTVGTKFVEFSKKYSEQFLDVGIAEEHAATMAASMAHHGISVFLPLYSTFSQRAFDQILNDICRSDHHVVMGIDRAGIIGDDGSTHQGLFDVSMFYLMPNIVIVMPYNAKEASDLLYYGFVKQKHPFVIRYPRGLTISKDSVTGISFTDIKPTWTILSEGAKVIMISYGPSLDLLLRVKEMFPIDAMVVNARFIKPIDEEMLHKICKTNLAILVYEEVANTGSLYPQILKFMAKHRYKNEITEMSITDKVVEHGSYKKVLSCQNMDEKAVTKKLKELMKSKK